jgi:hypothetical protein
VVLRCSFSDRRCSSRASITIACSVVRTVNRTNVATPVIGTARLRPPQWSAGTTSSATIATMREGDSVV